MDRHEIWRRVQYDFERMQEAAPEGYEPVVEVFVVGRDEPIELGFVETRRPAEEQWIRFQARSRQPFDGTTRRPDEFWCHVHESLVGRVELSFRRSGGRAFGFAHAIADDPPGSSEDARADQPDGSHA